MYVVGYLLSTLPGSGLLHLNLHFLLSQRLRIIAERNERLLRLL